MEFGVGTYIDQIKNSYYIVVYIPKILIGLGAVLILMTLIGPCGVVTGNSMCLSAYLFLSSAMLIGQVVIGAYGLKEFSGSTYAGLGHLEELLLSNIKAYYNSPFPVQSAIDYLQKSFDCCGVKGISDWTSPPPSCCEKFESNTCESNRSKGCGKEIYDYIQSNMSLIWKVVYGIAGFQAFGIVTTYALLLRLGSD
ncbi:hypothetical protein PPYR_11211 [Photinus pyralis]|uniref:Tetraspanin n=1 Tax=Photinus pyralis TaxID=7054 RepID=A0A5N4AAM2_PHOPY|nr:hypothetical protein PPYR_11211 [Photinus pyralis]